MTKGDPVDRFLFLRSVAVTVLPIFRIDFCPLRGRNILGHSVKDTRHAVHVKCGAGGREGREGSRVQTEPTGMQKNSVFYGYRRQAMYV